MATANIPTTPQCSSSSPPSLQSGTPVLSSELVLTTYLPHSGELEHPRKRLACDSDSSTASSQTRLASDLDQWAAYHQPGSPSRSVSCHLLSRARKHFKVQPESQRSGSATLEPRISAKSGIRTGLAGWLVGRRSTASALLYSTANGLMSVFRSRRAKEQQSHKPARHRRLV